MSEVFCSGLAIMQNYLHRQDVEHSVHNPRNVSEPGSMCACFPEFVNSLAA